MKTAVICLSKNGFKIAQDINNGMPENQVDIYVPSKVMRLLRRTNGSPRNDNQDIEAIIKYDFPLADVITKIFNQYDSLIFIMALGIVVREIAPLVSTKDSDPAVITIDEHAKFCISTLGGHEAGANNLVKEISVITGALPIITTASEESGIVIGIGLKKNKPKEEIKKAILSALNKKNLDISEVKKILTIDIKKSDQELREACLDLSIPLDFVSKEQINALDAIYEASDFVDKSIGVKAVCQPAALIGSDNKQIIMKKTVYDGITIAIAR